MRRRRVALFHGAIIAAVTLVVYSGSFDGQFVSDDTQSIYENVLIRSLDWQAVVQMFRTFDGANYMPIKVLSLAVDYRVWGPAPLGFHVTNLLLHILCALLVYRLLVRLAMAPPWAFATALLWSIHPLQVESVAWMSERKNVLSGFFFFWAFLTYVTFSQSRRWRSYAGLLALYVLALLSKMNTVVLPAVCLAYELAFRFRLRRSDVVASVPLFVLGALVVWYNLAGNPVHGTLFHGGSAVVTWLSSAVVLFRYLGHVILPVDLRVYYSVPLRTSVFDPAVALSLVGMMFIAVITVWQLAARRSSAFWILWFALTLSPMLNLIPFPSLMQDRYMYLALLGPLALVTSALYPLQRSPIARQALAASAAAAIIVCAVLSYRQVEVWDNPFALWRQWALREWYQASDFPTAPDRDHARRLAALGEAVEQDPASAVLYNNSGALNLDAGQLQDALNQLERAEQLAPDAPVVLLNLGRAYRRSGDLIRAEAVLRRATELDPRSFFAHLNLARLYLKHGAAADARGELQACEAIRPLRTIHAWLRPEYQQLEELEAGSSGVPP